MLREPIAQFLLLGFLIWAAVQFASGSAGRYEIDVDEARIARIASVFASQYREKPTPAQLRGLVDRYIWEEISYREGKALQLEKDDEIVRRRIVQKFEFLLNDQSIPEEPNKAQLETWFVAERARYQIPELVSFTHIYFSPDEAGDEVAYRSAIAVLSKIDNRARGPELGDPFPGAVDANNLSATEASRLFGRSPIVEVLFKTPVGRWTGPY